MCARDYEILHPIPSAKRKRSDVVYVITIFQLMPAPKASSELTSVLIENIL